MPIIGYHASHEQILPSDLLSFLKAAEEAGFGAAMCSDHLSPWSERQGNSGHAWSWLGAALEATSLSLGVVTSPGQRYHPAVSAQAIATLAEMYPARFWAALGSGEALNEHVTGTPWPNKAERDGRLLEAVGVIRALLDGEEVTHDGRVRVDRARVWSLPAERPPLVGAAVSESTARVVGGWADGLVTVNQPVDVLERVVAGFREGGGEDKPAYLQVHLSWAESDGKARQIAHDQWRSSVFGSTLAWNLETPAQFDAVGEFVRPEDMDDAVLISSDLDQHAAWLAEFSEIGFDRIYLHHVGQQQDEFIAAFGETVLPEFAT